MPRGDFTSPELYAQIAANNPRQPGVPAASGGYDPDSLFVLPSDQKEFIYPSEKPGYRPESYDPADLFVLPSEAPPPKAELPAAKTWADVPSQALSNLPESAYRFGQNVVQPIIHPVETAENIGNLGKGLLQKSGLMSGDSHIKYADAVWDDLLDRYGSLESLKKTLSTDPVGVMADASLLLTGGGMAAARVPGMIGRAGEVARTAGRVTDPLMAPFAAARGAGNIASHALNITTNAGPEALQYAARAGYQGGEAAKQFREQMRGKAPMEGVVDDAMDAVSNMRRKRGEAYRAEMAKLGADTTVLSFDKIDDALAEVTKVKTFKGIPINEKTQAIRQEIGQTIAEWKQLPPDQFHTPEGLDALKQKIGDIRNATQPGTPERVVANDAYRAIRSTIVAQAPQYKKIMSAYETSSELLNDLEKTLSLNERASTDTILRKLQSILRNNVNTSFGYRRQLAQYLLDNGSPNLLHALAGQALQPWTPRGLGKLGLQIGGILGTALGGGAHLAGAALPGAGAIGLAGWAAASSPRLMGEAAYYGGRGARLGEQVRRPEYYAGRVGDAQREAEAEAQRRNFQPGPYIRINGQ
jgi:hypothetical protein